MSCVLTLQQPTKTVCGDPTRQPAKTVCSDPLRKDSV